MSQLAESIQPQRQSVQNPQQTPQKSTHQLTEPKRRLITPGEKVLWTMGVMMIVVFAIIMVAKEAAIYSANREISQVEASIESETKTNDELQVQVTELKAPDRLIRIAKELGLSLNDKNIKVLPN